MTPCVSLSNAMPCPWKTRYAASSAKRCKAQGKRNRDGKCAGVVRHHSRLGGVAIRRVDLLPRSQAVPYAYSIDVGITPVSDAFSISILTTLPVLSNSRITPGLASPLQTLGVAAYHGKHGRILKQLLTSNHRTTEPPCRTRVPTPAPSPPVGRRVASGACRARR